MSDSNKPLECPVSEASCPWLDEVENLRQQIVGLADLVLTDALTGLYNYRHFENILQAEMDRSKRSGIPTSLVMIDLDHFKQINDTHGHEVGNAVLKVVADTLISEVRTTDVVCRYGGEEFAIIFPETHLNLAVKVADRIRESIAMTPIINGSDELNVTASMGASVYIKSSTLTLEEFVDSVDKYLYEAKQSGRNCICHIDYNDLRSATEVGVDERAMLMELNRTEN
ncbi:MAG: GGDEF domain-containing protein [Gammaproteobacteria bacterium]|nr:GGDEF domain-containing protein [Gammaproteobacteria bacterium]